MPAILAATSSPMTIRMTLMTVAITTPMMAAMKLSPPRVCTKASPMASTSPMPSRIIGSVKSR
jgi:hypothetical protein